jgi:hypothetical protein
MGQPKAIACSRSYNQTIREATLRWSMIDVLKHPSQGFETVGGTRCLCVWCVYVWCVCVSVCGVFVGCVRGHVCGVYAVAS